MQIIFVDVTLNFVSWIFCESKLLIGACEDGSLRLFSLLNGQEIHTDVNFKSSALTSMAVNNKKYSNNLVVLLFI